MKNENNTKKSLYKLFFVSIVALCLSAASALAMDLAQAKQAGMVGEKPTGYLAAVSSSPTSEVNQLISKTNAARKAEYERIAKKNGTKLSVVEQFGGKEAIERTEAGHYVFVGGAWKKK